MAHLGASKSKIDPNAIYEKYVASFKKQYPSLKGYQSETISELATQFQTQMAKDLHASINIRTLSSDRIQALLKLANSGTLLIMMRHGEQETSELVKNLKSNAEQKIAMMRHEENRNNSITLSSLIDSMSAMIALRYIQDNTNVSIKVESSINNRAMQPARGLASMLDVNAIHNSELDCIDYIPELSDSDLLTLLPSGSLPWPKSEDDQKGIKLVDRIAGDETYRYITDSTKKLIHHTPENDNQIQVKITHTQQINKLCQMLKLDVKRLETFGFVLVPFNALKQCVLCDNGFYSNQPKLKLNDAIISEVPTIQPILNQFSKRTQNDEFSGTTQPLDESKPHPKTRKPKC